MGESHRFGPKTVLKNKILSLLHVLPASEVALSG